jgi:glycosyltransferase involved in cell wall biosynthesis
MKKALIITYMWPPMEGVGVTRALKFAKYLPLYGWHPVILTVKPDRPMPECGNADVVRTDYRDVIGSLRGMMPGRRESSGAAGLSNSSPASGGQDGRASLLREIVAMPDDQIGWYGFAVRDGIKLLETEKIDIIFSTSPPETAHLIARKLKKACGIPWVADLRDLWADDHFRDRPFVKKAALKFLERKVLADADSVVTVSKPWAKRLEMSLGGGKGIVKVVENGFDDEDFRYGPVVRNEKFTISYTGKLHKHHQPVTQFFGALRDLLNEGRIDRRKIEVNFYVFGYDKPDMTGMAKSFGVEDVVKELGRVSYERSLEIQRASDALLFVQWRGEGGDGWYSAKIYDYIGSRRRILALADGGGITAELIRNTGSGIIADDEPGVKKALLSLYGEFTGHGGAGINPDNAATGALTRKNRTGELARIFDSICSEGRR